MLENRQDSYNKFTDFSKVPYNCITYLMNNNEMLWKLLQYPSADAWSKANLTKSQKGALIYDGIKTDTTCRVFLDLGMDSTWTEQVGIFRLSVAELIPSNYVYGHGTIAMECYSHYKVNTLSNYVSRVDLMTENIISTFNGAEIEGLGRLYFDARQNAKSRAVTIGDVAYKGKAVIMCYHALGD